MAMSLSHTRNSFLLSFLLAGTIACSAAPLEPGPGESGTSAGGTVTNAGTGGAVGGSVTPGTGSSTSTTTGGSVAAGGTSTGTGAATSTGTGGVEDPGLGGTREEVAASCDPGAALNLGTTRLRRLTRDQLDNTLRDLFGTGEVDYASVLAPDETVGPFHSNSIAPVTDLIVQQLAEVAQAAATDALAVSTNFVPCDLAADTTTACVTQFVQEFGSRAYRRPLTTDEETALVNLYVMGRDGTSAERGLEMVLLAVLQSGSFLYLSDTGQSGAPTATPDPATPHTLASRLSYFLWNTMPDEVLKAAADDGSLTDEAVFTAQLERALADPKARGAIQLFHERWLDVAELPGHEKDASAFPQYSAQLAQEMLDDQAAFVNSVILEGDGLLSTLLSSPVAFPSAGVADIYGVMAPAVAGDAVSLPADQRGGLLTQPAFLATHARSLDSSPVHRGIIVRENILCEIIPPPPAGVSTDLPPKTEGMTTREQFAVHLENPTCANCHELIDPIGLAFEHYDAVGAWRDADGTGEIDARGEVLYSGEDVAGEFDGVLELSAKLSQSMAASDCLTRQWFRFALGRVESESDACSMLSLFEGFESSGGNVKTLLSQIALSDAFRNVRLTGGDSQ